MTALDLLRSLGSTADEVAAELGRRGIKGVRGKCLSCPLVNVLNAEGFDQAWVDAGTFSAMHSDGTIESNYLPVACRELVDRFDSGHYPFLESEAA